MGRNILIVESQNDKYFLNAVINHLNLQIDIASPIFILLADDYREMGGLSPENLRKALKDLKADIQKGEIERIGIVIDVDQETKEKRIEFVNEAVQAVFSDPPHLQSTNEFIDLKFDDFNIQLACFFTNVDGKGELETVLKLIKSQDSTHADCLESWKSCLENKGKEIREKDFDKFWISVYLRFDTCSNTEKRQAGTKCSMSGFKYIMGNKVSIWDLDHPVLDDLKQFLRLFC